MAARRGARSRLRIATFNVNIIWRTNDFGRVYLVNYVLNCIQFTISIRKNVCFYKNIVDYKTNITSKNLVVIFNHFWTKNFHIIFLKYFVERIHFVNHIFVNRISSCENVF